jgi:hypothetical protein
MGLVTERGLSEGNAECPKQVRGSDEGFPEMTIGLHDDTFIIVGLRRAWWEVEHFLKGKLVPLHDMKARGIMEVRLHSFLTSALDASEWSSLHPRYSTA